MDLLSSSTLLYGLLALVIFIAFRYFTAASPGAAKSRYVSADTQKKKFVKPAVLTDYSPEEVAKHNSADDCWLIIDGKVYDVTTYVPEHPGDMAIARNAGRDSSVGFHGEQHGESVYAQVEEYRIGNLIK